MTERVRARYLETAVVLLLSLVFAVWFGHATFQHFGVSHDDETREDDWDLFTELRWTPYLEVTQYHQFPLWDPYRCSGVPLLGYAESGFLSPWFLLSLIFGPLAGADLEILVHLAIALAGGYVLGRVLGLGKLARLGCASVFPASSWFYLHIAIGHLTFLPYAYLPWILALYMMSLKRRLLWPAAIAGLLFAVSLGEGGLAHMFIYSLPLLGLLSILFAAFELSFWPLISGMTTLFFALALGAIKLLPVAAYSSSRPIIDTEYTTLTMFVQMLFSRNQDLQRNLVGANWHFWEYGAYLGFPFAGLALLGLFGSPKRAMPWVIAALAMVAIAAGNFAAGSPWNWMHSVPVFDSIRVPSRWIIPFIAAIAPLVGYGIDNLAHDVRWRRVIAGLLILAGLIDASMVVTGNLGHLTANPLPEVTRAKRFRQVWDPSERHMFRFARAGLGSLDCENEVITKHLGVALGSNQPGYRGEQYLKGAGTVDVHRWSPNVLEYEIDVPDATTLIVNQNYDAGWGVSQGRGNVSEDNGLLAVALPAGHQRLVLSYLGSAFEIGAAVSLFALIALIMLVIYEARRGKPEPLLARDRE